MRDAQAWENHAPQRCMTPRCPHPRVAGRARCSRHGPSNAKWWSGLGYNPYSKNQERRMQREQAGEGCAMAYTGGCRGPLHLDHILPLSLGGQAVPENEQLLCQRHNIKKGGRNRVSRV